MDGQCPDFTVRSPDTSAGIHRVEREAEARDLGRRDPQSRKGAGKRPQAQEPAPEDAVDVSEEYLSEHEPQAVESAETSGGTGEGGRAHLDIEV